VIDHTTSKWGRSISRKSRGGTEVAYRFGTAAEARLESRLRPLHTPEGRGALILDWARARGRVSRTEVADFGGVAVPYAGTLLTNLEADGLLVGSRQKRQGRGFFYRPVG